MTDDVTLLRQDLRQARDNLNILDGDYTECLKELLEARRERDQARRLACTAEEELARCRENFRILAGR